jgi:ATP-dependent DNA helicase RecG
MCMSHGDVADVLAPPRDRVGERLQAMPENQWFERKGRLVSARKLANALVGMANADGGTIVVGLGEDGTVQGTDSDPAHRNSLMQVGVDLVMPPVRAVMTLIDCITTNGRPDHLLVLDVGPSGVVHATVRDEVFLRLGDHTRKLSFVERRELGFDKGQAGYEAEIVPDAGLDDLDEELLASYAGSVGHADPRRLLEARGLLRSGKLTVAGHLLFATTPQALFPNAHVRVSRFAGHERGHGARQQLVSDVRIEGPLPRLLLSARTQVAAVQPVRRALGRGGLFEDVPLVPEDAWLEGVVNAVVHRSYSLAGDHVHVDVFDDRIEIESPGRFPGIVDLAHPLELTRFARNPRVARVCADLKLGEDLGEGIRRMFEEMRLAGLDDPMYRQTAASVRLTLSGEPVNRALDARLPEQARVVVAALRESARLSTGDLAQVMGLSRPAAIRKLNELRNADVIAWEGKSARDPRAYWRLVR